MPSSYVAPAASEPNLNGAAQCLQDILQVLQGKHLQQQAPAGDASGGAATRRLSQSAPLPDLPKLREPMDFGAKLPRITSPAQMTREAYLEPAKAVPSRFMDPMGEMTFRRSSPPMGSRRRSASLTNVGERPERSSRTDSFRRVRFQLPRDTDEEDGEVYSLLRKLQKREQELAVLRDQREEETGRHTGDMRLKDSELQQCRAHCSQQAAQIQGLQMQLDARSAECRHLRQQVSDHASELQRAFSALTSREQELAKLKSTFETELRQARASLAQKETELLSLQREADAAFACRGRGAPPEDFGRSCSASLDWADNGMKLAPLPPPPLPASPQGSAGHSDYRDYRRDDGFPTPSSY
eukprot:TRINITY_DN37687_c0_g1_i1.p1 TRINITY_DN37687_c0_g1~~TRINITY_DN37687_c0_g1_i1.p1  ORF type:complete len:355 (+),score=60.39 TRINITY_DN37687_c0_g1_i1:151-1215(+)